MGVDNLLLSIIMPSHVDRWPFPIVGQIRDQCDRLNGNGTPVVEFICILDNGPLSIGEKMNRMYEMAQGAYIAGVGDDDLVTPDYVTSLVEAIRANPGIDVVSFDHTYYSSDKFIAMTVVSKDLDNGHAEQVHSRKPTPKCAIRSDICKQFKSSNISDREDVAMVKWLDGKLETEVRIQRPLYTHAYDRKNGPWREAQMKKWKRG